MSAPLPDFAHRLIAWQKQHGRHDLPWQQSHEAYRVWLSEIMLQQTQVAAVIPYYQRFLERFPDLASLARAPLADVLEAWSGLGYYARARNLHRCARQVVELHGGRFPSDPETLQSLAGIGRSTAAAIAVFSAGQRAAILDGNVKRVFCRHAGIATPPGEAQTEKQLWQLAEARLPLSDLKAYTQGLMDLGATLCTRRHPRCPACPVREDCRAALGGLQDEWPVPRARKALPERSTIFVLIFDGQAVLLQRRPPSGIWGGMLAPPEGDPQTIIANLGVSIAVSETLPERVHTFTHFRLRIAPVLYRIDRRPSGAMEPGWHWQAIAQIDNAALPAPVRQLLSTLPA